jgi:hypothetical protein
VEITMAIPTLRNSSDTWTLTKIRGRRNKRNEIFMNAEGYTLKNQITNTVIIN